MRKLFLVIVAIGLLFGPIAKNSIADWSSADGHKMHYPQLPNPTGWDVNATSPLTLADDWMCSETGWVKDIHFWGSWKHGMESLILKFKLSIHSNIPASLDTPWSSPGRLLWEYEIGNFITVPITTPTPEGWYDPQGEIYPNDHMVLLPVQHLLTTDDVVLSVQG